MCAILGTLRYVKQLNKNDIDNVTLKELHPVFTGFYTPFNTTGNGNCLYNMISISLIGNESLNILIRALTVFTFIKNENNS